MLRPGNWAAGGAVAGAASGDLDLRPSAGTVIARLRGLRLRLPARFLCAVLPRSRRELVPFLVVARRLRIDRLALAAMLRMCLGVACESPPPPSKSPISISMSASTHPGGSFLLDRPSTTLK